MLVAILIGLVNTGIFIQDIRQRSVHVLLLILLSFTLMLGASTGLVDASLENLFSNCTILLIQLAMLTLYFSLKERKWVLITEKYLGLGDILFLLIVAPFFNPHGFLLYLVASFILALCCALIYTLFSKRKSTSIPLLSFLSLMLVLCGYVDLYLPGLSFEFSNHFQAWNY
jgi:hypothetical protein